MKSCLLFKSLVYGMLTIALMAALAACKKTEAPYVITQEVSDINLVTGTASVTFNGTIVNVGVPAYTERGFVYNTLPNPDIEHGTKQIVSGSGTGNYSASITDLPMGVTTYYVRAYATHTKKTVYGRPFEFTTIPNYVILLDSGLMVQKQDVEEGTFRELREGTFRTMDSLCNNSTLDGFKDWRLPTKDELNVLYINRNEIGGFNTDEFIKSDRYWSSTTDFNGYSYWAKSFRTGDMYEYSYEAQLSARCVRKYR